MNGFEINKIIAALIFTVLVVFGIGKISDIIFNVEKPSQAAYVVEAPTIQTTTSASSDSGSVDIKALLAMGTLEHGKKVFDLLGISQEYLQAEIYEMFPTVFFFPLSEEQCDMIALLWEKACS